ncbi:MAG: division/cell wall cluster transcriptional repressor MraZ [Candidatus Villigracilaceae bacterium]
MFLGQYQHNLDEKGRLMIPVRFRELLPEGAFITQGFDRCLMVMTPAYFEEVYRRINAMNLADPAVRMLRRQILANAFGVEVDKLGRILVPSILRQFASLEGEAVVAGQGEYFEIWSPVLWAGQMAEIQDPEAGGQRYAALNLSGQV